MFGLNYSKWLFVTFWQRHHMFFLVETRFEKSYVFQRDKWRWKCCQVFFLIHIFGIPLFSVELNEYAIVRRTFLHNKWDSEFGFHVTFWLSCYFFSLIHHEREKKIRVFVPAPQFIHSWKWLRYMLACGIYGFSLTFAVFIVYTQRFFLCMFVRECLLTVARLCHIHFDVIFCSSKTFNSFFYSYNFLPSPYWYLVVYSHLLRSRNE